MATNNINGIVHSEIDHSLSHHVRYQCHTLSIISIEKNSFQNGKQKECYNDYGDLDRFQLFYLNSLT